jgi:hypothetical protein
MFGVPKYTVIMLVDIVPVSNEEPVGVDQEQFFEEEQSKFLGEEGKRTSPPTYYIYAIQLHDN